MTAKQSGKADATPTDSTAQPSPRVPFDQVLRRLVDGQQKKPAPKPSKPPKKL